VAVVRDRPAKWPFAWLLSGLFMASAIYGTSWEFKREDAANRRQSILLVDAIERYRADTGRYPVRLADLQPKYLPRVPKCQYGLWRLNFAYWFDLTGKPQFKFVQNMGLVGQFYDFDDKRWFGDAVM
jgi:hypothetical protein